MTDSVNRLGDMYNVQKVQNPFSSIYNTVHHKIEFIELRASLTVVICMENLLIKCVSTFYFPHNNLLKFLTCINQSLILA